MGQDESQRFPVEGSDGLIDELNDRFRGPLTPVVGYTQMLLAGELGGLTGPQGRAVEMIGAAADNLLSTTVHFVELAHAGRLLLVAADAGARRRTGGAVAAAPRTPGEPSPSVIDLRGLPLDSQVLMRVLARATRIASGADRTLVFRVADDGTMPLLTAAELDVYLARRPGCR